MSLINVKYGEVDVSTYDLRYVPVEDIVAENRTPSLNLSISTDNSRGLVKEEEAAMAEKSAAKKDQQKNKKSKQNEKKKNQENGVKHMNEQHVHDTNQVNQKKKDKSNKNNAKSAPKKNIKSGSGDSLFKRFFQLFFISTSYLFLAAGFLYLVDYDKYMKVKEGGITVLNKTLSFLPEEVVNKGKDILIPAAEAIVQRLNLVIKETAAFLNTNPVIKDHWTNLREIGSMCGGCLVEYLRTLYNHVTNYWCDAKSKLF